MKAEENTEKKTKKNVEWRSTLEWNEIFSMCANPFYKYFLIFFSYFQSNQSNFQS